MLEDEGQCQDQDRPRPRPRLRPRLRVRCKIEFAVEIGGQHHDQNHSKHKAVITAELHHKVADPIIKVIHLQCKYNKIMRKLW